MGGSVQPVNDDVSVRIASIDSSAGRCQELASPRVLRPTLVGYWDREARNVRANDAHVDNFGLTPSDLRGRHISALFGPSGYAVARPHIEAALRGIEHSFAPTLVERDGVAWYCQESFIPDVVDGKVRGFYHQRIDVTARIEAEHARDDVVRLYEISMTNAPIAKTILDTAGFVVQVNPAMCELLGYPASEVIGTDFRRYVAPEDLESGEADLAALVSGSVKQVASERRYVQRDGTVVWMQRNAVLVPGAYGAADVVIAQFQDVSHRRRVEAELARLAVTDPLTGLRNRYALVGDVEGRRSERPDALLGVIFVDLDGFKRINDAHGHAVGDEVLGQAASRLTEVIGPSAWAYRVGGDEFVVLDPDPPTPTHTADLAQRIRVALTGIHHTSDAAVTLTASVGWTNGPTKDVDDLLHAADADMYRHKRTQERQSSAG